MKKLLLFFVVVIAMSICNNLMAQCQSCTFSIAGSGSDLNINNGQTVCITSGTQNGNINFNGSGTLCISSNATLSSNNINNFGNGSSINIYGTANFANSLNLGAGTLNNYNVLAFGNSPNLSGSITINNYGTLTFNNSVSFNGAAVINNYKSTLFSNPPNFNSSVTFNNDKEGTFTFNQATTISNSSTFLNNGFIYAKADFSTNAGTNFTNNNRLHTDANFNPAGNFTNYGIVVAKGFINFNSGDKMVNYCRLVAVKGFNNNDNDAENYGLIWVPGATNGTELIQINSAIKNQGYFRTPRFINNASIANTSGQIRIEGNTNPSEMASRNNSGTISGGTVCDASNGQLAPAYRFDDNTGTITASYDAVPAYDTATAAFVSNCASLYFPTYTISGTIHHDVNGLDIDGPGIGGPSSSTPIQQLYVNLVRNGIILGNVAVTANGIYSIGAAQGLLANTDGYLLILSPTQGVTGQSSASLASLGSIAGGWVNIGEDSTVAGDGNPDGILSFSIGAANISSADFAIEEKPVAGNGSQTVINPGANAAVTINPLAFTSTASSADPTTNTVTGIIITAMPTGASSITINGITYGPSFTPFPANGISIRSAAAGNPLQSIAVHPELSSTSSGAVDIPFRSVDAAGVLSDNTGHAVITIVGSPDLTPRVIMSPSVTYGATTFTAIVRVNNLSNVPSTGTIRVFIPKNFNFPLGFDASQTSAHGIPVQNSQWTFTDNDPEYPSFYILTTNHGIEGGSRLAIGLAGIMQQGAVTGKFTVAATVFPGSGNETYSANNTNSESISYFK